MKSQSSQAVCQPANKRLHPSFVSRADEQFGEQNFKSAVALIELHRVRRGLLISHSSRFGHLDFKGKETR
jgi:4-hydroxyphenylpyruvate dioxygenase-like putative hemolysin